MADGEGSAAVAAPPAAATAAPSAPVETPAASQPAPAPAQPAATEFDISKYIDKNGEFLPGWKEGLIDKERWNEGFYDQVKGVKGLLKTALDTKKMMGKKTIVPLTEKSTSEEIEAYRQAHGITGKYNYAPPKDINLVDMSPEVMAPILAELDKGHFTQKQVDTAVGIYQKSIQQLEKDIAANDKAEFEEAERIIKSEYQTDEDYQNGIHLANRLIEENTAGWPEAKKAAFLDAVNESTLKPYILDFIKTIGNKFVEHKLITNMEASMGPADFEAAIAEEMAKPAYRNASDPAHKLAVAKVQKMFQEKEDRKKKLASQGVI
jgi:hypothetical protein